MFFEHMVYDARHFFGEDGSGHRSGRFAGFGQVEAFDFRIKLDRMHGDFGESEFEVFVAIFVSGLMFEFLVGIAGAGHQSTIGEEVFVVGKAFDAVDLQVEREGGDFTDTRHPEQALNIGDAHRSRG